MMMMIHDITTIDNYLLLFMYYLLAGRKGQAWLWLFLFLWLYGQQAYNRKRKSGGGGRWWQVVGGWWVSGIVGEWNSRIPTCTEPVCS